ncbi:transcriptional regulator [archaeon SCG-AAA382B04]|nr:transcriptional regulator [archaeon SCG-AAA382B04]
MKEKDKNCCGDNKPFLCPVEGIIDIISKKWSLCIISRLGEKKEGYRFNELQRSLDGISPKSLTDRLKELTENNLVNRDVKESIPPKVTYTLTKEGKQLNQKLKPLLKWINEKS